MSNEIRCTDGCGAHVASEADAQQQAWTCLAITGRYRCPKCSRELAAINIRPEHMKGADSMMDELR